MNGHGATLRNRSKMTRSQSGTGFVVMHNEPDRVDWTDRSTVVQADRATAPHGNTKGRALHAP